jgi:hypothetical protein
MRCGEIVCSWVRGFAPCIEQGERWWAKKKCCAFRERGYSERVPENLFLTAYEYRRLHFHALLPARWKT